ncbi:MAG: hypothetical protein Hyperionvirus28_8 [Hyperionvirus sp.]|uniref:Uncharacterized protein n=1 Tax=Hyperionvirus sp. TaxID=2487770 RepID=A0A3G5ABE3_9VIRU|nr:MAG: hypothetical protein Hyperionvirus28_8 [Hyperionvirus sp.]
MPDDFIKTISDLDCEIHQLKKKLRKLAEVVHESGIRLDAEIARLEQQIAELEKRVNRLTNYPVGRMQMTISATGPLREVTFSSGGIFNPIKGITITDDNGFFKVDQAGLYEFNLSFLSIGGQTGVPPEFFDFGPFLRIMRGTGVQLFDLYRTTAFTGQMNVSPTFLFQFELADQISFLFQVPENITISPSNSVYIHKVSDPLV